ncbi:MAG: LytTR family transcriptional regulator DNA-binding domain-containing protein [Bacteroidales bacterium]|nr:MAG: LytTR family transcriptional regulator DNA-binding domain-containing protein [Bacteroidales bacterium]
MIIWETKIPEYLTRKQNIIRTVLFTAVFALAFINFYSPFGVNIWYDITTKIQLFLYSSLIILTGVLVIVISRIIMYHYSKVKRLNYVQYILWVIAEIISMAAFYAVFVKFILKDERYFIDIFKVSIKNTSLVLLLPYSILSLYFSWRFKSKQLEELSYKDKLAESSKKMIPFHDEKGALRFSILLEDILYLEAADNYVTIYYIDNGKITKYLIRNSLKNLESRLQPRNIMRCHRSYMVNFEKVKIMRKEKGGLFLELDTDYKFSLPVSRTYVAQIIEAFSEYTE